ncbi:urea ABC transporter substrate-binding protein [Candidatus Haliotispira prima]|uniref:Urea ABC transporter substrate-binding protein n=1 Tax=Candidatus Haliotispira prima TaxID=3034016 RepID=A0ABY8MJA6_9SPIO|nr:urea ABC transporter substrate-binding protein [Candidatus Haliotispira prima]
MTTKSKRQGLGFCILIISATFIMGCGKTTTDEIKVGILHSLSGTMSISEVAVRDASLMAIKEINAAGGLLGKQIIPVVEDGASDWPTFAEKATKLIQSDKVNVVFGCWTSASRKAVLPVFEKFDHLLFYPVQYEGMEASKNIVYTGAAPNQQIMPAVTWLLEKGYKKFYLLGSDYVFPRTANQIIIKQLEVEGGELVAEEYTPLGHVEYTTVINKIKEADPDVIFNTLNGDSNVAFFKQLKSAGISATDIPVMSVSIAEEELIGIGPSNVAGHYAAWNYFMSMDTPGNAAFIKNYKAMYGENRVTDDPIEAGYFGVYLWAEAVKKAGTFEVGAVREAVRGIEFEAPEGKVTVDPANNHTWKIAQIGKIRSDGQFDIVWSTDGPVQPNPFPALVSNKKVLAPGQITE